MAVEHARLPIWARSDIGFLTRPPNRCMELTLPNLELAHLKHAHTDIANPHQLGRQSWPIAAIPHSHFSEIGSGFAELFRKCFPHDCCPVLHEQLPRKWFRAKVCWAICRLNVMGLNFTTLHMEMEELIFCGNVDNL